MIFVYVLHFNEKLGDHAQHYIGSTRHLERRLKSHRQRPDASIMKAVGERNITWELAALFQATDAGGRRIERTCKEAKNAAKYCPVCSLRPATPPGAIPYPIDVCHFPTTSWSIVPEDKPIYTWETLRPETTTAEDHAAILRLMQSHTHELGYLPKSETSGFIRHLANGQILAAHHVAPSRRELVHYTLYSSNLNERSIKVQQCVTHDAHRNQGVAHQALRILRNLHPSATLSCKVRWDLPANHFWQKIGWEHIGDERHPTSRQLLHHYQVAPLQTELESCITP